MPDGRGFGLGNKQRTRQAAGDRRTEYIQVRVSPNERREIEQKARTRKCASIAEFIRDAVLTGKATVVDDGRI